jgi:hypothetical protein
LTFRKSRAPTQSPVGRNSFVGSPTFFGLVLSFALGVPCVALFAVLFYYRKKVYVSCCKRVNTVNDPRQVQFGTAVVTQPSTVPATSYTLLDSNSTFSGDAVTASDAAPIATIASAGPAPRRTVSSKVNSPATSKPQNVSSETPSLIDESSSQSSGSSESYSSDEENQPPISKSARKNKTASSRTPAKKKEMTESVGTAKKSVSSQSSSDIFASFFNTPESTEQPTVPTHQVGYYLFLNILNHSKILLC